MNCPTCGKSTLVASRMGFKSSRNTTELAMNVNSRWRICEDGHRFKTVEMDACELADLRRRAYLHELAGAKAA